MKNGFAVLGLLAGLIAADAARAQVGLTAAVGTSGVGGHLSLPLRPSLHLRFGTGYFRYDYLEKSSYIDYDYKLTVNTVDALLDWFPVRNAGFRLTTGLVYNANRIEGQARPNISGSYRIGDHLYTIDSIGVVNGKVDVRKFAPYLGIGWTKSLSRHQGWALSADLGVLFQGTPRTSLESSGCTIHKVVCDFLAADLAREEAELNDDLREFKHYPVVRIGLSYRF